jgi:hypothetical protein
MKIFLSSTALDLIAHRKAAAEAIERLGQQPGRMEVFGARAEEPLTASLAELDECDLFVGIYAHRYGFVPAGSDISITESEFDHALKSNKPIFCFVVSDDFPWPPKMIEDGEAKERLTELKKRIGAGVVRDTFTTPDDLAVKVATSIGRYLAQKTPPRTELNPYIENLKKCGDLEELLDRGLRELEAATITDYNQIFLSSTSAYSKHLVAVADAMPEHKQRYRIATFAGLLGTVFSSGKTLNAGMVRERKGYFQAVLETRSELVVPIGTGTAVLGVLNSESEEEDHFTSAMVLRTERLADALAQLLPLFGWAPGRADEEAPWIQRMPSIHAGPNSLRKSRQAWMSQKGKPTARPSRPSTRRRQTPSRCARRLDAFSSPRARGRSSF